MAKAKLRLLLYGIWYFIVFLILMAILFLDFDFSNNLWFFIPYLIVCTLVGPLINKIAPKQKRSDDDGNN